MSTNTIITTTVTTTTITMTTSTTNATTSFSASSSPPNNPSTSITTPSKHTNVEKLRSRNFIIPENENSYNPVENLSEEEVEDLGMKDEDLVSDKNNNNISNIHKSFNNTNPKTYNNNTSNNTNTSNTNNTTNYNTPKNNTNKDFENFEDSNKADSGEIDETGFYCESDESLPDSAHSLDAFNKVADLIAEPALESGDFDVVVTTEKLKFDQQQQQQHLDDYQKHNYQQIKNKIQQQQQLHKYYPVQLQKVFPQQQKPHSKRPIQGQHLQQHYDTNQVWQCENLTKQNNHQQQQQNFQNQQKHQQLLPTQLCNFQVQQQLYQHPQNVYNMKALHLPQQNLRTKPQHKLLLQQQEQHEIKFATDYYPTPNFQQIQAETQHSFLNLDNVKKLREENKDLKKKAEEWMRKYKDLKEADKNETSMLRIQAALYKEDFDKERADRENAMGRLDEAERKLKSAEEMLNFYKFSTLPSRFDKNESVSGVNNPF